MAWFYLVIAGLLEIVWAVDANADPECKDLVRTQLLPQSRSHIPVLDRLIDVQ